MYSVLAQLSTSAKKKLKCLDQVKSVNCKKDANIICYISLCILISQDFYRKMKV